MRIYLAATWESRERMRGTANILRKLGNIVTSRWLEDQHTQGTRAECAQIDLDDIDRADAIVLFSVGPRGTKFQGGGRCIEFGYAIAREKALILIGEVESVFHELPQVKQFLTFQAFLDSGLADN